LVAVGPWQPLEWLKAVFEWYCAQARPSAASLPDGTDFYIALTWGLAGGAVKC